MPEGDSAWRAARRRRAHPVGRALLASRRPVPRYATEVVRRLSRDPARPALEALLDQGTLAGIDDLRAVETRPGLRRGGNEQLLGSRPRRAAGRPGYARWAEPSRA